MTQTEFVRSLGFHQSTATDWKRRGWIVFGADGSVDVDASRSRLLEARGTLGPLAGRAKSRRSPWSRYPGCTTRRAIESGRRIRGHE